MLLCEVTLSANESDFSCVRNMGVVSRTVRCIYYHLKENLKQKVNCTDKALVWLSG